MSYGNGGEYQTTGIGASMDARAMQQANVPTTTPPILGELDAQRKTLGMLAEVTQVLEQRLQLVLAPIPLNAAESKDAAAPPSQIAARIGDHTRGMRIIHERLASIINRLEL